MKKFSVFLTMAVLFLVFATYSHAVEIIFIPKGSIIVYGFPAVGPEDERYENQAYLALETTKAKKSGIYSPFWGDLKTWDDTEYPMEKRRCFWGHIEMAFEDRYVEPISVLEAVPGEPFSIFVVLRPELIKQVATVDGIVEQYRDLLCKCIGYNQPFLQVDIYWIKKGKEEKRINWFVPPETFAWWNETCKINFDALPYPERFQFGPEGISFTDISSDEFKYRTTDCSVVLAWAIILEIDAQDETESWRNFFLGNYPAVGAVECVAPGQLAWFLEKNGYYEIAYAYSSQPSQ